MWDSLLSGNIRVIGLASDDAHIHKAPFTSRIAIGGRGWNVVKTESLSRDNILAAIRKGHCYATTGVILDEYLVSKSGITIRIKPIGDEKTCIEFIGQGGRRLQRNYSHNAAYRFNGNETYVRCRITSTAGLHAWTQPVFLDKLESAIKWTSAP